MKENTDEVLIDLLIKKATYGLTDAEQAELDKLENGRHDNSFDLTVSAISLIDERGEDAMPAHLRSNIRAAAEAYFDDKEDATRKERIPERLGIASQLPRPSFWNWFGWAVAAAACIALAANIYLTRVHPGAEIGYVKPTPEKTRELTFADMRQQLIETASDLRRAQWASPDKKAPDKVSGDIVWSDSKQSGYMVLRGLPVNDKTKETYQLWIFDETQSEKTPIDGGIFDVNENGEVIIPVNAKLKAKNPKLFAITIEKPGGVVVSDRRKVAALGKVET